MTLFVDADGFIRIIYLADGGKGMAMQKNHIRLEDFYGIEIYHVHDALGTESVSLQNTPHSHDYFELTLHISGELDIFVEDAIYRLHGGEVRLYASGELHYGIKRKKAPSEWYQIKIPSCFLEYAEGGLLMRIFLERRFGEGNVFVSAYHDEMVSILKNAFAFYHAENPFAQSYAKYGILQLLCLVNQAENNQKAEAYSSSALQTVLNLIGREYRDLMTVGDIAMRSHFSVSYINKLFQRHLCISPYQFLLGKKFDAAKKALKEGRSVTDACLAAGFHDYSNFITMFRKRYGVTPYHYGKRSK